MARVKFKSVTAKWYESQYSINAIVTVKAMVEVFVQYFDISYTTFVSGSTREEVKNKIICEFENIISENAYDNFEERLAVRDNLVTSIKWKRIQATEHDIAFNKMNEKIRKLYE